MWKTVTDSEVKYGMHNIRIDAVGVVVILHMEEKTIQNQTEKAANIIHIRKYYKHF